MKKKDNIQKYLETILRLHKKYHFTKKNGYFKFSSEVSSEFIQDIEPISSQIIPEISYIDKEKNVEKVDEWTTLKSQSGLTVTVSLSQDALISNGFPVYQDWASFLEYKKNFFTIPDDCLLLQDELIFSQCKNQKKFCHYKRVHSVLQLLKDNADHLQCFSDDIINEYLFLHRSALLISSKKLNGDFLEIELDGLDILNSILSENSHEQQKKSIFREVLYGLLIDVPEEKRLEYLFRNFSEFSKRINENYQLFVSEFSFDKVRLEYEEAKRDYFLKINDIFSSIQAKMLGVPISIVLTAIELNDPENSSDDLSTLLIRIAIIVYSIFMFMLLINQNHTLKSIKEEYTSQMKRLKYHYTAQYEQIGDILGELDKRALFQKVLLKFCAVIVVLLVLAVIFFFIPDNQILSN